MDILIKYGEDDLRENADFINTEEVNIYCGKDGGMNFSDIISQ